MKKILFVISTLNTGGAQRIFSNIIMALPKDWEINILLNDDKDIAYPYRGKIIDLGMPPEENKEKVSYQIKALFRRIGILKKIKDNNGYDACISAMDSANIVNVLTGKKHCKCILTVHGFHPKGWVNKLVEPIVNWLIKVVYKNADSVVTVSKGLYREMHEKFNVPEEKLMVIYNGYDVMDICSGKEREGELELPWTDDSDVIITTGRLEKIKGQWHLIKAFSILAKNSPKARLVILGDGMLRKELEELVRFYDIEEKVFMPGFVKNPFAYYEKAKVFVLSSLSEGYPNAIAEAMICGLPCVSVDCESGPREMLTDGAKTDVVMDTYRLEKYGVLCPAFDSGDLWDNMTIGNEELILAEAIETVLCDDRILQGYQRMSLEKAHDFDMKNIVKHWIDICSNRDEQEKI